MGVAFAGGGDGLAGKPGRDEVDLGSRLGLPPGGEGCDVVMAGHSWPVAGEDRAAERVQLDLGGQVPAGAFQAEVQPANA